MAMEYLGLSDINGPLVAVDGVKGVGFEEMVEMKTATGTRLGRIAALEGERAVIQVCISVFFHLFYHIRDIFLRIGLPFPQIKSYVQFSIILL